MTTRPSMATDGRGEKLDLSMMQSELYQNYWYRVENFSTEKLLERIMSSTGLVKKFREDI